VATQPPSDTLLLHYLKTLRFRFLHVLQDAPADFADFSAGDDVRTPREMIHHMVGLLHFTGKQYGITLAVPEASVSLEVLQDSFIEGLTELSSVMQATTLSQAEGSLSLEQLIQGPLADAMTHIGQLAMLRRLSGSPVARLRYWLVVL
jgi:hypothetical protein